MSMQTGWRLGQYAPTIRLGIIGFEFVESDTLHRVLALAAMVQDETAVECKGSTAARRRHWRQRAPRIRFAVINVVQTYIIDSGGHAAAKNMDRAIHHQHSEMIARHGQARRGGPTVCGRIINAVG